MSNLNEFIQQQYYQEITAKEHITNKVQGSIATYAAFFVSAVYMIRMVDYESNQVLLTLFNIGVFFWFVFFVCAAFYTGKSISGHSYRLMPDPLEWIEYKESIEADAKAIAEYNATFGANEKEINVEEVLFGEINKLMARCTEFNSNINEIRQVGYTKSFGFLVKSIFPLLISSILFVVFDMDASSPRKEDSNQGTKIAKTIELVSECKRTAQITRDNINSNANID